MRGLKGGWRSLGGGVRYWCASARVFVVGFLFVGLVGCVSEPAPISSISTSPGFVNDWPNASDTGVPDGLELTAYSGPCVIDQPGAVIDAKLIDCSLRIRAADVVITRSRINGNINLREADGDSSFSISDSEVHVGSALVTGIGNGNFSVNRVEITGGARSILCITSCTIENSWVHSQAGDPSGQAHLSGIRMGQRTVVRNNTIVCDGPRTPPGSGCSAGLTGYGGSFGPVRQNLIERNLFVRGDSSFCAFGGSSRGKEFSEQARDVVFRDNVFERGSNGKCGNLGPVSGFDSTAPGNVWQRNTWDDGSILDAPEFRV
jgi:hypothetical protein